ncbi:hypothetical protein LTR78_003818 [Recurvomyces mirabilis]|uniref:Uncharacterized protein n=1 Tax=Recurvomyces mirabilis TaxID=574656 RepID=A0AAE1C3A6_9PEZI|nr:hypothetical protein LTR78_003818 [Recurvomyces mirabilis]KAK5154930.1 hypothetical protein LTS14_006511 [Recurvomyces mirabilis]
MDDAISNLGGGGLSKPWLANLANCLNYAFSFLITLAGGPLINKIGIKWSCFIAALSMPLGASSYYTNAKFDNEWYLLTANLVKGIAGGFLYVAESTAMMSYPRLEDRGFYLGIWTAMRNSGSVIGGAINFSTDSEKSSAGGIATSTYLIFLAIQCTGVIWALLLSPTRVIRRRDGQKVPMAEMISWKQEFKALWRFMQRRTSLYMLLPAFYSFFCGGTFGTYLSLHFSVRARALSSLLVPTIVIPSVLLFGKLLDAQWIPRQRRAWLSFLLWAVPQGGCLIWVAVEYKILGSKTALDYELNTTPWARAYMPYLIMFVGCYWTQLSLYWILSATSRDVKESARAGGMFRAAETAGQAISYGLSSASGIAVTIPLYVHCGIWILTMPSMVMLIHSMPAESSTEINGLDRVDEIEGVRDAQIAKV